MFTYDYTIEGKVDLTKAWQLYANVKLWQEWDESLKNVSLNGSFEAGTTGIMEMQNGQALPFVLENVLYKKEFTTLSKLGKLSVMVIHILNETSITHKVVIDGGEEKQMEAMGNAISANIPKSVQALFSIAKNEIF